MPAIGATGMSSGNQEAAGVARICVNSSTTLVLSPDPF